MPRSIDHDRIVQNRFVAIAAALLLSIHAGLLAYSATRHSPTVLEPAFLASGIGHWQLGNFQLYRVNPPLPRMVAAIPALIMGCETEWHKIREWPGSRAEYPVGEDFIAVNGARSITLLFFARWACIPFSLLGGWIAFRWAGELYGPAAGLLTLVLWVFEPNLLAHAELITPDCACWSCGLLAGYTFWRWLKAPSWKTAGQAGLALGLAELTKLTWLVLFGLWPMLWVAWVGLRYFRTPSPVAGSAVRPSGKQLLAILAFALLVLNLGYGFDGFGARLKDLTFVSTQLTGHATAGEPGNRFQGSWAGEIPLPLPTQYVLGLDTQARDLSDYRRPSFLLGEWKDGGWWYYYLFGLAVKVPSGIWLLFLSVVIYRLFQKTRPASFCDEMVLLTPAVVVLVLCSSQTEINEHLRYAYPSLAIILIWLGQAATMPVAAAASALHARAGGFRAAAVRFGLVSLVASTVISTLLVYPHHLSYFNEFAGGPSQGWKYLRGSSFDWGQDLLEVARFEATLGETFQYRTNRSQMITLDAARQYVIGHRQKRSSGVVLTVDDYEFGSKLMDAAAHKIARTHVVVPGVAGDLQAHEDPTPVPEHRFAAPAISRRSGQARPLVMSVPVPF